MAEIDDLYSALEKADAAGNAGDARELAAHIRSLEGSPKAASAEPTAPGVSPRRGSKGFFDDGGGLEAGIVGATEAATFGAAGPVAAYIASRMNGRPYDQVRAEQQAYEKSLAAENPWSHGIGSVVGSIGTGLGIARGVAKVAPGVVSMVTPKAAEGIARTGGRLALGGAAAGAGSNLAETGVDVAERELGGADTVTKTPVGDAIVAGGIGALAGPVAGAAASQAGKVVAKVGDALQGDNLGKGWRFLAKKLDVDPQTLRGAIDDYGNLTGGQRASIAQVMDMRQQGVLAEIGRDKSAAGAVFREAADDASNALPGQVRDQVRRTTGIPRAEPELKMATAAPADRFMTDPQTGQRITDAVSLNTAELRGLQGQNFASATRSLPPEMRQRVAAALNDGDQLSTSELDVVRRHVSDWGDKSPGNKSAAVPLERVLADAAERSSPGYKQAVLRDFETGKLRETGFKAGQTLEPNTGVMGGTIRQGDELTGYGEGVARRVWNKAGEGPGGAARAADELASSTNMEDALRGAYGNDTAGELIEGARALRSGQTSLETIAPARARGSSEATDAKEATDAFVGLAAAGAGHPVAMASRISRLLPSKLSDAMAERLSRELVSNDPRRVATAIANLRRAGATNSHIAELQGAAARVAGDRMDPRSERVRKRAGQ